MAWGPSAKVQWRFHRGTWDNKDPAITFQVLAKHRSATPEAPTYPVKHRCSQAQDWQTVEWTTFQPQKAYLLRYVYCYLTQGHEGNIDYVRMNRVATEIIRQGVGVYATRTPTGSQHAVGHHGTGSTHPCLPTTDAMAPAALGRPQHRHFRGCLRRYKPHSSGQGGQLWR